MKINRRFACFAVAVCCACAATSLVQAVTPDSVDRVVMPIEALAQGFENPPTEARPFVRWWWNDNRVEKDEVLRELDLLKDAGIGGVEINPIAYGRPYKTKAEQLVWRSPEWDQVLLAACKGAHERGMIVDMIAGSGWPFGGEFLRPEEQIMRLSFIKRTVKGPQTVTFTQQSILEQSEGRQSHGENRIESIKLYPVKIGSLDPIRDITEKSSDGTLTVEIPPGEFVWPLAFAGKASEPTSGREPGDPGVRRWAITTNRSHARTSTV